MLHLRQLGHSLWQAVGVHLLHLLLSILSKLLLLLLLLMVELHCCLSCQSLLGRHLLIAESVKVSLWLSRLSNDLLDLQLLQCSVLNKAV